MAEQLLEIGLYFDELDPTSGIQARFRNLLYPLHFLLL